MTSNQRIILNILATYGRSLFGLACGIFSGRWVLMSLGEVDYGLFGVVGGMTSFIAFFNSNLASSVGRFYAYAVGQAKISGKESYGIEECRKWFNTALTVHIAVPTVLLLIGYPTGLWMVQNFLAIPAEKIHSCIWVWRFVCLSCFISMVSVPVNAMYTAKQYIAELTLYSFAASVANVCCLYYMVTHPGYWLSRYALITCLIAIIPQILIAIRGLQTFPECKVQCSYMGEWKRISSICSFAGWNVIAALGSLLQGQGIAILINKYFGPKVNAAMGIANNVNGQVLSLSSAMNGAFSPAITNACGAGDDNSMRTLAYRCCKLGLVMSLLFVIPLSLEVSEVMRLWLKNPPHYTSSFIVCMLINAIIGEATTGHMIAVRAKGKVAFYLSFLGIVLICAFPLAWLFVAIGFGALSVMFALLIISCIAMAGRVYLARDLAGMSIRFWLVHIILPVMFVTLVSYFVGLMPRMFMPSGFGRILVTSIVCEMIYLPMSWIFILDLSERQYIVGRIYNLLHKTR